jgi:hypothetical protein
MLLLQHAPHSRQLQQPHAAAKLTFDAEKTAKFHSDNTNIEKNATPTFFKAKTKIHSIT